MMTRLNDGTIPDHNMITIFRARKTFKMKLFSGMEMAIIHTGKKHANSIRHMNNSSLINNYLKWQKKCPTFLVQKLGLFIISPRLNPSPQHAVNQSQKTYSSNYSRPGA